MFCANCGRPVPVGGQLRSKWGAEPEPTFENTAARLTGAAAHR